MRELQMSIQKNCQIAGVLKGTPSTRPKGAGRSIVKRASP